MKKVEFFKGDRKLSLWYIPIVLIWVFFGIGEFGRILTSHDPLTMFLTVLPAVVFVAIISYLLFRYLSRWLAFILVPLSATLEFFWGLDPASAAAQRGISLQLLIVIWAVEGVFSLIPPYFITKFITKQWKNVPVWLILAGVMVFLAGLQVSSLTGPDGLGPILSVIISPLLIISGVVYYLYKRRQRKTKK